MKKSLIISCALFVTTACMARQGALPPPAIQATASSSAVTTAPPISYTTTPILPPTYSALLTQIAPAPTPLLTATPIQLGSSSTSTVTIINQLFDHTNCDALNYLTPLSPLAPGVLPDYHIGKPKLSYVTNWTNLQIVIIDEIADSLMGSYRAYLVEEVGTPTECPQCEMQSRVYVQDRARDRFYRIDWSHYVPSRYLFGLTWIGDSILTFFQSLSPYGYDYMGVDVQTQEFVYYSGLSCKHPY
jgi:hypothetical protein